MKNLPNAIKCPPRKPASKLLSLLLCAVGATAAHAAEMVPFQLPYDDSSENIVSLASTLTAPAGSMGYIHAGPDGHLYEGEEPIRFLGFNVGAGSNFPQHEIADKVSGRLAKFGTNIVRFHQLDFGWAKGQRNIFGVNGSDTLELDSESMDRFAYFVYALKEKGIYTNINLLCSRYFTSADGLPIEVDELGFSDSQRVGMFYQPLIDLQKRYAKQVLSYENPYTGLTLAEDPAVAVVEIYNENGLVIGWHSGYTGRLRSKPMPAVFEEDLMRQWNEWLLDRYGSTEDLMRVWKVDYADGAATNLVQNGDFSNGTEGWDLSLKQGAVVKARAVSDAQYGHVARVEVDEPGTAGWSVELRQALALEQNKGYTVRFKGRADEASHMKFYMQEAEEPWGARSLDHHIHLEPTWQEFEYTFLADKADLRINFSSLLSGGVNYYFADVEVVPNTFPDDQALEVGNVSLYLSTVSEQALRDWYAFLYYLESTFYSEMSDYLKNELGCDALLVGSQVLFSMSTIMAELDIVDTHYYWEHPKFGGQGWSPENWTINNISMVNDPELELAGLGVRRVYGKPFIMTEYDHPAPNFYSGEAPIMSAIYAAMQDWDGIFYFLYQGNNDTEGWDKGYVSRFFDYSPHPTKMANMILAANLYRRGDLSPNDIQVEIPLSQSMEQELIFQRRPGLFGTQFYEIPPELAFQHQVGVSLTEDAAEAYPLVFEEEIVASTITSDTGEFVWDRTNLEAGLITVDTPKTKVLLGYTEGDTVQLDGLAIQTIREKNWQIIGLTAQDNKPLVESGRMLLIANGITENTNMGWTDENHVSVGTDWGEAPSLVGLVSARVSMEHEQPIRVWALDEKGDRVEEIAVSKSTEGRYEFTIGLSIPTIWYEIAAQTSERN